MEKVIAKDFREVKTMTLPTSGITVSFYSSLLVGGLPAKTPDETDMDANLNIIVKMIKEWNFYNSEADEKPLEINLENFKRLPAGDFQALMEEIKVFSTEQKKS